ncbi:MAG: hypothetical protein HQ557_09685 [Bacteroidetes bacterium]|nr:hypothetical protein [Bacteroidota bacterium]
MSDSKKVIDLYLRRKEEREVKLKDFFDPGGSTKFLIIPRMTHALYTGCDSLEMIYRNNVDYLERQLSIDYCDDLPYLEPWIGSGVYAHAYGAKYLWGEGKAPDTIHRYETIDEVKGLAYPDYRKSSIMQMVLDSIDILKERTNGRIPISLTDTQSPQDTATLIMDTTEFLIGMYTDPETIHELLDNVTKLKIEFSHVQIDHIGRDLLASPGHGFAGMPFLAGIGVSDDDMVFSSPDFNEQFSFPYINKLSDEFGGIALHSCGNWVKSMPRLKSLNNLKMIDFAIPGNLTDSNPNSCTEVKAALHGIDCILKVRPGDDIDLTIRDLQELCGADNGDGGRKKIIVEYPYSGDDYVEDFKVIEETLNNLYH